MIRGAGDPAHCGGMETQPLYVPPREGLRGLFGSGNFLRLWTIGGVVNAMRWVEMLAAGLFTFEATGSGFAVAAVSAARTLPLLLFGAMAGVVCETLDRKRVLFAGLLVSALASLCICVLAAFGVVRTWHIAGAAFVSGSVWATEMATRRRMVGESAGPALISRAVPARAASGR
jgi:MFS family permease